MRAYDAGARAHLDVLERAVGPDDRVLRHDGRPEQLHPGQDRDVRLELDVDVDPGGGGIDDRHAVLHPAGQDPVVLLLGQCRELRAVVGTFGLQHVVDRERPDGLAVLARELDGVGEVVLPLGVVVAQPRQHPVEERRVEGEDPAVDLGDRRLLRGGVLLLDDAGHLAGVVAQDPAVAVGVRHHTGQDAHHSSAPRRGPRRRRAGPPPRGAGCRRPPPARSPRGRRVQRLPGHAYGVPGALLGLLDRQHRVGEQLLDVRPDLLALVADDGHDPVRMECRDRLEHVRDHAAPGDGVQHLHGLRLHPGAAAGREDDDGHWPMVAGWLVVLTLPG